MSTKPQKARRTKPRFKVGDWVTYVIGNSRHACQIIEYVGTVGKNQVHYYRLREPMWYGPPQEIDYPETSLEPTTEDDLARRYPPEERDAHAPQPR